ncbi:PLP-dependent transferase [Athelia psychrophila]|uniref:serine C-palmitoyltransferase n=1 Tax=Athelia psychrophila TaxID=1759441 RepID=A0A166N2R4_9AGAM|nr:PLP-dependent transferase [Fibularhizoctonia sp. CBS 109695]
MPSSAASYLSALSKADAQARRSHNSTPPGTPALSMSSSITAESELEDPFSLANDTDSTDLMRPRTAPTSEQVFTTVHAEFGHCANQDYRYTSEHGPDDDLSHVDVEPPYYILLSTYASYLLLIVMGHLRDFVGKRFRPAAYKDLKATNGYAPLSSDFDSFYIRRLKLRINDCFSQPITGVAGRTVTILDRTTQNYNATQELTGTTTRTLNISSYNYLGFGQARGGCADAVEACLQRYGVSTLGARLEGGTSDLHVLAEALVARFVGAEAAVISSMGYATNSTFIPALVGKGCLVISDELNHASIRIGVRYSGASVRMFKHNDMHALEALLREVVSQGQPKTHRHWKKILVIVEGLYSMEGTMVDLPGILALKKQYKFNLFVDEAHSIGAIGPHGRGVCDYFGIDPREVDILMGTFTKSFGAAGGYVAGSTALIDCLRVHGHSGPYAEAMAPPVLAQVVSSMASIMGVAPAHTSTSTLQPAHREPHPAAAPASALPAWMALPPAQRDGSEGHERLRRLAFNSRYMARALKKLGFITYGHPSSPIVPLLIFNPGKLPLFHRLMKDRATPIVVVVVSYPATPLVSGRVRFCLSAAHTKDDIDTVLGACDEIGDLLDLKHGVGERWPLEEIMERSVELVHMDVHE